MSDLNEGMRMLSLTFASLTKIEIVTNDAFVSEPNDWTSSTTIACNMLMNDLRGTSFRFLRNFGTSGL